MIVSGDNRRIHHLVTQHLPALKDHTVLIAEDLHLSYGRFNDICHDFSDFFRDLGVGGGDRILIIAENSIVQMASLMAASMLGAWAVMVNARLSESEITSIFDHSNPRIALFSSSVSTDALRHAKRMDANHHHISGLSFHATNSNLDAIAEPVSESSAEQVAVMIYTTGTTGAPKGVMLTHKNLLFSSSVSCRSRSTGPDDIAYAALPITHVYGLSSVVLAAISAGASIRLIARFDPTDVVSWLEEGVTMFYGVPAMYVKLLEVNAKGINIRAPRLRLIHCGGAPLDDDLKQRAEALFHHLPINNGYGMTEASPSIAMVPYNERANGSTVGHLIPGLQCRIVDNNGNTVNAGEVGELLIKGPNIMKGYYRAPEATKEVLTDDGWLHTNDLVRQDPDGSLYVMGRIKDLIIRSGFNVYPSEVEAALNKHPKIAQSCVVGKQVKGDEQIIAFVQPEPDASIEQNDILNFLSGHLTPYKRPQKIIIVSQFPTAPTGKILKREVQKLANEYVSTSHDQQIR